MIVAQLFLLFRHVFIDKNMKSINSIILLIVSIIICAGCSQECDTFLISLPGDACDSIYTVEMDFNVEKPSYDEGPTTRATNAGVWEDGDVVYLRLSNNGGAANATATYHASTNKWEMTYNRTLVELSNATCKLSYCTGVNPQKMDDGFMYSYMTGLYRTTTEAPGSYSFSNNKIKVTAKLECSGWRMRFKGNPGTKLFLYNMNMNVRNHHRYNTEYDSETGLPVTMTVGSNGYTDYYVLGTIKEECTCIAITDLSSGETYYRKFGISIVGSDYYGKSFCFSIPSVSDLKGWKRSNIVTGSSDGHDYIDLGLPSGTFWASCNVGASSVAGNGEYYQWAETATDTYYGWSTYKYCNGSQKTLTKYCDTPSYGTVDNIMELELSDDVAHEKWGSSWRIPSYAMFEELKNECSWCWLNSNGQTGMIVVGPNGRSIFLPAAGYREQSNKLKIGEQGRYQTANVRAGNPSAMWYLSVDDKDVVLSYFDRCCGYSVRPVYDPNLDYDEGNPQDINLDGYGSDQCLD